MRLPLPRTIFAQTLTLTLFVAGLTVFVSFSVLFNRPPPDYRPPTVYELARIARGLPLAGQVPPYRVDELATPPGPSSPDDRMSEILSEMLAARLELPIARVRLISNQPHLGDRMVHRLERELELYTEENGGNPIVFGSFKMAVQLADGRWRVWTFSDMRPLSRWRWEMVRLILLGMLLLFPLAFLFARRLVFPIRSFATAATTMGRNPGTMPIAETGPVEIADTARAFNAMQERISRYLLERTSMISAVAHDLRTPLARLRFRIEDVDPQVREQVLHDLDEMEAMIAAVLQFVRDDSHAAPHVPVDLRALLQRLTDSYRELGKPVSLAGKSVRVCGDPDALRRAFTNLIDNALRFGTVAEISVGSDDDRAYVTVSDKGKGMSKEEIACAFEPFWRGEGSRNRETGGAGLGLAIVRSLLVSHDGDITLHNRAEGGLAAHVTLPVTDSDLEDDGMSEGVVQR